jgi:CheY-like chemotaxis protein
LKEEDFELILLDLMMPEMDRFEFTRILRENERWRSIPVILVTAKDMTEEDRNRLNGDIHGVISKERPQPRSSYSGNSGSSSRQRGARGRD